MTDARLGWFAAGFLAATLAAALFEARPAAAQDSSVLKGGQWPAPAKEAANRRPAAAPVPGPEDDGSYSPTPIPPTEESGEPPSEDEMEDDHDLPQAAPPKVPLDGTMPQDGNITDSPAADFPTDGSAAAGEPPPVEDGGDPTIDTRPLEERAVFEEPPPGFDPLLFVIEDIDPIVTDRRPERLFRLEPYDPIGIAIGSFILFPEIDLGGVATNNVEGTAGGHPDVGAEVASNTRLVSNWSRHAVELRGTTFSSFYDKHPSEDDRDWMAEARGRLDMTRRTNIQGLVSRDYGQESRSGIDGVATGQRPNVTTDLAAAALNHRFNRLSLQLRGSLTDVDYSETVNGGIVTTYRDQDVRSSDEALRLTYELKPSFSIFAEGVLNQRRHDEAPSDGILRNSKGERFRLGIDLGGLGEIWRGEASLGYGQQNPDDGRLATIEAFLIDANLAWRVTALTSLLFTARTEIYDTTTTDSPGVVAHQAGIEARHAFRTYFVATAGLSYTDNDYISSTINEQILTTIVGAEYFANRDMILYGRYQHDAFDSTQPSSDYHADTVRIGLRLRK